MYLCILIFQAIDMFMSSCTFFVFFSLIEYAFVNVMMGDIRNSIINNNIIPFYARMPI